MKARKIRGSVQFIPSLGWCLLTCDHATPADKLDRRRQLRRYWLVDWSKVNPPGAGVWEAITGDWTDRYHRDWCRPTKLIYEYELKQGVQR